MVDIGGQCLLPLAEAGYTVRMLREVLPSEDAPLPAVVEPCGGGLTASTAPAGHLLGASWGETEAERGSGGHPCSPTADGGDTPWLWWLARGRHGRQPEGDRDDSAALLTAGAEALLQAEGSRLRAWGRQGEPGEETQNHRFCLCACHSRATATSSAVIGMPSMK